MTSCLEWGVASRAHLGGRESGDHFLVVGSPARALVGVVDGLGHGPEAAAAAQQAVQALKDSVGAPITTLVQRCHSQLRRTRGAALTLATVDAAAATMSWLAIGDVDAVLWPAPGAGPQPRRRRRIVGRGGVVGSHLPELRVSTLAICPGDLLVMATDGIAAGFARDRPCAPPQAAAADLLERFAVASDDALVLAAVFTGSPP